MAMTEQVEQALTKANVVRLWRADQRKRIKAGDGELAIELLHGDDPRLASLPVGRFVEWLPGVSATRARRIVYRIFRWVSYTSELRRMDSLDKETRARLEVEIRKLPWYTSHQ